MRRYLKAFSAIQMLLILFSLSGCVKVDDSEGVYIAANKYSRKLCSCDMEKISTMTIRREDDKYEDWCRKLSFNDHTYYTIKELRVLNEIKDTMSYCVIDNSIACDMDKREASARVLFSIVDYNVIDEKGFEKAVDYLEEIPKTSMTKFEVNIKFKLVNGQWFCSNYQNVFDWVYDFTKGDYHFYEVRRKSTGSILESHDVTDTKRLTSKILIDEYENVSDYRYELVYQDRILMEGEGNECDYKIEDHEDAPLEPHGCYLADGAYDVIFYKNDVKVYKDWFNITNTVREYEALDHFRWYDTSNKDDYNPIYINTEYIHCDLLMEGSGYSPTRYEVRYKGEIVSSWEQKSYAYLYTLWATEEKYQYTMPFDPSGQYLAAGEYVVTFYDRFGEVLAEHSCTVIVDEDLMEQSDQI